MLPAAGQADVFLSAARIEVLQQRIAQKSEPTYTAFLALKKQADLAVNRSPVPPASWYVPGYYHDANAHWKAQKPLDTDSNAAYELALMYRLSGDPKYAVAAARILDAWASTLKTFSNKDDSMLTFSYHFPAMIFAAALVEQFSGWPTDRQQAFRDFVRNQALPMNTMSRPNNWGNWGLVLELAAAAYLHDQVLFDRGVSRWKEFIDTQIADDGHMIMEVGRNNNVGDHGLWYSHFSLMPQTLAAEILRINRTDLYDYRSPKGRTLRLAYERLVPWVADPKSFPYFKGPDMQVELKTNYEYISYWEILNAHWPQAQATALLRARRPLTASHCAPCLTLTHGDLLNDSGP